MTIPFSSHSHDRSFYFISVCDLSVCTVKVNIADKIISTSYIFLGFQCDLYIILLTKTRRFFLELANINLIPYISIHSFIYK